MWKAVVLATAMVSQQCTLGSDSGVNVNADDAEVEVWLQGVTDFAEPVGIWFALEVAAQESVLEERLMFEPGAVRRQDVSHERGRRLLAVDNLKAVYSRFSPHSKQERLTSGRRRYSSTDQSSFQASHAWW